MQDLINELVEVKADQELNALIVKFLDYVTSKQYKKIFEYEYALIEHYSLKKCFIDLRFLPAYARGMEDHVRNVWFPKVKALGVCHIAFAVPEAILGELSMRKAHQEAKFDAAIYVEHFKTEVEAMGWLRRC